MAHFFPYSGKLRIEFFWFCFSGRKKIQCSVYVFSSVFTGYSFLKQTISQKMGSTEDFEANVLSCGLFSNFTSVQL